MRLLALGLLALSAPAAGQDTIRLPALQDAAARQDPRVRQLMLEETATELRLRSIGVERLPELRLTGEALRQSEAAGIPVELASIEIPAPPKERYELALNAGWLLYDGGVVGARRDAERARLATARARLAVELFPLRIEVNESFFRALILQERLREISLLIEDLEARLAEVRDHVRAGAALPGDTAAVVAEVLRAVQHRDEVAADRRASLAVLSKLTGRAIAEGHVLDLPDLTAEVARFRSAAERKPPERAEAAGARVHPQYALFEAQRERLELEAAVIRARARPRLSAFGEYAYGKPGLRQFTDDPHDYWRAGVRFHWVPWDWGTVGREVESMRMEQQILETEEAAFSARLQRQVQQPLRTMDRLRAALEVDGRIIALRKQVERQARAQLAERAITAATYVDARTDLLESRIILLRHRAELARAQADYLTTLGVELR